MSLLQRPVVFLILRGFWHPTSDISSRSITKSRPVNGVTLERSREFPGILLRTLLEDVPVGEIVATRAGW